MPKQIYRSSAHADIPFLHTRRYAVPTYTQISRSYIHADFPFLRTRGYAVPPHSRGYAVSLHAQICCSSIRANMPLPRTRVDVPRNVDLILRPRTVPPYTRRYAVPPYTRGYPIPPRTRICRSSAQFKTSILRTPAKLYHNSHRFKVLQFKLLMQHKGGYKRTMGFKRLPHLRRPPLQCFDGALAEPTPQTEPATSNGACRP